MFWKKKTGEKKLSPKDIIINQIDVLTEGQSAVYKLPEIYWTGLGGFIVIERNSQKGEKSKPFVAFTDEIKDGAPVGKKKRLWEFNYAREMASWIIERGGVLYP